MDLAVRGTNILVVEDDIAVARLLCWFLQQAGWATHRAATLASALKVLEAALEVPQVIILDWSLPDGYGQDLLRALFAAEPEIPVVICTGYMLGQREIGALQTQWPNLFGYLQKPCTKGALCALVSQALGHRT